jgi:hypothetical protein
LSRIPNSAPIGHPALQHRVQFDILTASLHKS